MHLKPKAIWFTGLSGSGKTTQAKLLLSYLRARGVSTVLLDGDEIRSSTTSRLGFSKEDREINLKSIAQLTRKEIEEGKVVIVATISPFTKIREICKRVVGDNNFLEIYMKSSLSLCEGRDVKGLYRLAREGKILNFTGIDSPYEPPHNPDIILETERESEEETFSNLICSLDTISR